MWFFGKKKRKRSDEDYFRAIGITVEVLKEATSGDHQSIVAEIVAAGVEDAELARLLYQLIPIAFGRVMLEESGLPLPGYFLVVSPKNGATTQHLFAEDPVFQHIQTRLPFIFQEGISERQTQNILMRSTEVRAINKALQDGADPNNLKLQPPVLR